MSPPTTAHLVSLAQIAGIDCDDVAVTQLDSQVWQAELRCQGRAVVQVDSEIGLSASHALERLKHVADALARGHLRVLAAKVAGARAREADARVAYLAASNAATLACLALNALDPGTAPTDAIEQRLRDSRAKSAASDAAFARRQNLSKLRVRAERTHEKTQDAYDKLYPLALAKATAGV